MTNKQIYREICKEEKTIPIFSKDFWLDCVCEQDNWDVILLKSNGRVIASLPYYIRRSKIFNRITMPKLTQTMGIWIKYPEQQKYANKLAYEKEIFLNLINSLPKCDQFNQNFHYSISNWLPFYWMGFNQTTRYTYVIENLNNLDNLFLNFRENIRREIRKAEKIVKIYSNDNIEEFYRLNSMTFLRQNIKIPYSLDFIRKLDKACSKMNCRKIFFAKDEKGRLHSAIYIIWDNESAYYLMGGSNPELRNSGATSLLMWEAIRFASQVTKKFDFEGSMIEPIEKFFRAFGATQKPYFNISKTNSKLLMLIQGLKEVIR